MWKQEKMQELDISGNIVKQISPQIGRLSELKTLRANRCKLESVPNSVAALSRAHLIELKANLLGSFLPKIRREDVLLHSLVTLDLSNNRLTAIPSALKYIPTLANLLLAYNRITEINKLCRVEFGGLFVLDVSDNKLNSLPNAFAFHLKKIQNLNLANNDLSKLPPNLSLLPQLKTIQVLPLSSKPGVDRREPAEEHQTDDRGEGLGRSYRLPQAEIQRGGRLAD